MVPLPHYNLLKYEYGTVVSVDSKHEKMVATYNFYKTVLMKYYPDQIVELFEWAKKYSEEQLKDVGLKLVIREGMTPSADSHELIKTLYGDTIMGRVVYRDRSIVTSHPSVREATTMDDIVEETFGEFIAADPRFAQGIEARTPSVAQTIRSRDGETGTTFRIVDTERGSFQIGFNTVSHIR